MGYTITTSDGKTSNLSKPLIPLGDTDSDEIKAAVYEPVFAIGEPYKDFGEAAARVYLRDIFGNQSSEPTTYKINYRINNFKRDLKQDITELRELITAQASK